MNRVPVALRIPAVLYLLLCVAHAPANPPAVYSLLRIPVSGGAYVDPEQPPAAPVPPPGLEKKVDDLTNEIREMNRKLDKLLNALDEATDPETWRDAKPAAGENAGKQALFIQAGNTCTGCHTDAAAKGKKFTIFRTEKEGKVLRDDFSRREIRKLISEVEDGTMPHISSGKKLTREQKDAWIEEMKARLAQTDR
jgi:hypothetical protein